MLVDGAIFDLSESHAVEARLDVLWENRLSKTTDRSELLDGQLVRLTLSGDDKAFEVLVRRYQKMVYNVIYRMINSHEAAADLTQETFVRGYKALHRFRQGASFRPWLLKIATNACLNSIRDTKQCDSLESLLEENPQLEPASQYDLEEEVAIRFSHDQLNAALSTVYESAPDLRVALPARLQLW